MSSHFAWDYNGAGRTPQGAVGMLYDARARACLSDWWAGHQIPANIVLPANNAIIISGTTSDLQQALATDIGKGIVSISVPNLMACWYFRRSAGWETHTVASIASVQGYWGFDQNNPSSSGYYWYQLHSGYINNGGISLQDLSQNLLPAVKGVKGWY